MKDLNRNAKAFIFAGMVIGLLYLMRGGETVAAGGLAPLPRRQAVPNITVTDLNGGLWGLADHRGQVVLLNFWATWCPPCRQETPGLVRLGNAYGSKGLAILGIAMDDRSPEAVRAFVSAFHVPYPIALPDAHTPFASAIEALPTTLLIDKHGRLAKKYAGGASESTFRTDIDALLRESE